MAKIYARPYRRPRKRHTGMNREELAYSLHLEARKAAGEVTEFAFEALKVRLADQTWFTPDFRVVTPECIEIHEVKAQWRVKVKGKQQRVSREHWEDDARVKWKVAADLNPWARWVSVSRNPDGGWKLEEYGGGR